MAILKDIIDKTGKTKDVIAEEMNCTRATLYNWIQKPKTMQIQDIEKLAKIVRKTPRNLFSLIINN